MSDVPDWLWQGIATNLLADGLVAAGWLAWTYREEIANKLRRTPEDVGINLQPLTLRAEAQPVSIAVGSERQILYNVEAPTPSLARRLEELASWWLHVS